MPLVALEGVDGSGKSTLAKTLADRYIDADVYHVGVPQSVDTVIDETIGMLSDYDPAGERGVVYDRAGWGCPVYAPIYRPHLDHDGYGEIGHAGWRYVELFMESRGCVTVLVDAEPEVAAARCADRGEDLATAENFPRMVERYHRLFDESLTGTIVRRLATRHDTDLVANEALALARTKARVVSKISRYRHYVGPALPSMLVLCKPDRLVRVQALDELMQHRDWQTIGFASSAVSLIALEELWKLLGHPEAVVYGDVPDSVRHWVDLTT